jgi:hypothetical protein
MGELQTAINIVIIVVGTIVAMLAGDYIGYKVGRIRLAIVGGSIALLSIIGFTIYAAIVLI